MNSFFHTDPFYNTTFYYKEIPQPALAFANKYTPVQLAQYEKFVYFPTLFEKMRPSQVAQYRKRFVWRFLLWARKPANREKIGSNRIEDLQIVNSRWTDIMGSCAGGIIGGMFFNRFIYKMNIPLVNFLLEGQDPRMLAWIRKGSVSLLSGVVVYSTVQSILKMGYLFDLALRYKEEFAHGELVSPNCEEKIIRG